MHRRGVMFFGAKNKAIEEGLKSKLRVEQEGQNPKSVYFYNIHTYFLPAAC